MSLPVTPKLKGKYSVRNRPEGTEDLPRHNFDTALEAAKGHAEAFAKQIGLGSPVPDKDTGAEKDLPTKPGSPAESDDRVIEMSRIPGSEFVPPGRALAIATGEMPAPAKYSFDSGDGNPENADFKKALEATVQRLEFTRKIKIVAVRARVLDVTWWGYFFYVETDDHILWNFSGTATVTLGLDVQSSDGFWTSLSAGETEFETFFTFLVEEKPPAELPDEQATLSLDRLRTLRSGTYSRLSQPTTAARVLTDTTPGYALSAGTLTDGLTASEIGYSEHPLTHWEWLSRYWRLLGTLIDAHRADRPPNFVEEPPAPPAPRRRGARKADAELVYY